MSNRFDQPTRNKRLPDGSVMINDPLEQNSILLLCRMKVVLPFKLQNGEFESQVDFATEQASRLCPDPIVLNADALEHCRQCSRTRTQVIQEKKSFPNEIWMLCEPVFRFQPRNLGRITLRSWWSQTAIMLKTETIPTAFPGLMPSAISEPVVIDDDQRLAHRWVYGVMETSEYDAAAQSEILGVKSFKKSNTDPRFTSKIEPLQGKGSNR